MKMYISDPAGPESPCPPSKPGQSTAVVLAGHFENLVGNCINVLTNATKHFGSYQTLSTDGNFNEAELPCSTPMWVRDITSGFFNYLDLLNYQ